jgi:hypothetical protein
MLGGRMSRPRPRARRDLGGDFGEMQVHRFGVASGQDEGRAFAVLWADRAEDISRGGSLIFGWLGRLPRLAQRRVILFFWPTRASSANRTSMALLAFDLVQAPGGFLRNDPGVRISCSM